MAQDETSSAVFGLPQEAISLNAVARVASLQEIPQILVNNI
jgi:chemotaxis response regulator CheB